MIGLALSILGTLLLFACIGACALISLVFVVSVNPAPLRERKQDWFYILMMVGVTIQCIGALFAVWS